ncbi:hypothetical protein F8S13_12020 [Chloroflexia bacterium SDU3-3]|nr:hypothetical protein F8S13_12020 [Chloroflexia bacterium SDU3-3]
MKNETILSEIRQTLIGAILPSIIIFLVNLLIGYLFKETGNVKIGPIIDVSNHKYANISITNYSDSEIQGISITIPSSTIISNTISTSPVYIEKKSNLLTNLSTDLITISNIKPKDTTNLLIPIITADQLNLISVTNYSDLKLSTERSSSPRYPWDKAIFNMIISASMYFIFIIISNLLLNSQIKKTRSEIQKELEKSKEESRSLIQKIDDLNKDSKQYMNDFIKMKLLLLAKISDYTKELDFWKDTIRCIMYESSKENISSDMIIRTVNKTLKTYLTNESKTNISFDEMKIISSIFSKSSEND